MLIIVFKLAWDFCDGLGICTYNYKGVHLLSSFSPQLLGKKKKIARTSLSIFFFFFKEEIKEKPQKK